MNDGTSSGNLSWGLYLGQTMPFLPWVCRILQIYNTNGWNILFIYSIHIKFHTESTTFQVIGMFGQKKISAEQAPSVYGDGTYWYSIKQRWCLPSYYNGMVIFSVQIRCHPLKMVSNFGPFFFQLTLFFCIWVGIFHLHTEIGANWDGLTSLDSEMEPSDRDTLNPTSCLTRSARLLSEVCAACLTYISFLINNLVQLRDDMHHRHKFRFLFALIG